MSATTPAAVTARLDAHDDDYQLAQRGIEALIRLCGDDPTREGLAETPGRWVRAMLELADRTHGPTAGSLLSRVFPDVNTGGEPITVGPMPFRTVCEHHLLPFTGNAWIAYTPAPDGVVGLSKLPRLVALHARRLNVQESMTLNIAQDIATYLWPRGYSVAIVAEHTCTTLRGAVSTGTLMRTAAFGGTHDTANERARMEHSILHQTSR